MQRLLLALALALAAPACLAWNAAGHRIAAAVAWQQLSPAARSAVAALLAAHPDYRRWTDAGHDDSAYGAFLEASTWPDDIRRDPRFHDDDEPPPPPLPGFPDRSRHKRWHFVDSDAAGHRREGELDRQIDRLARVLADPHASMAERSYALPWLVHLVADGHQPLHVGVHDDEGGNRVDIDDPFNPRLPLTTLHTWWDDLPGPPWLRGKRLDQVVGALLARHPAPAQDDPAAWLQESRELAWEAVYPPAGGGQRPVIDENFRAAGRVLANRRLVEAGYRLGRLLDGLLAGVPRGTDRPASNPGK